MSETTNTITENTTTENTTTEENANSVTSVTTTTTRSRRTREKIRSLEELRNAPLKTLSDKEKNVLIDYYRSEINKLTAQTQCYKNNAESSLEKARMFENLLEQHKRTTNLKLQDIAQATSTLHKTIYLMAKEGMSND